MGSYLSRARPCPPWPALRGGDRLEKPGRLRPAHARRVPPASRANSAAWSLALTRRLSYEDRVASPRRRQHRRRLLVVHRQRYPMERARCLHLRVFSSAPWRGRQHQPALPASSSRMLCTSVILKMASAKGRLTLRVALEQSVVYIWPSLADHLSNPHAKEALMRALRESTQVRAEEEKALTTPGDRRKALAEHQDGHMALERQDGPRRGSDGRGSAQSAFQSLMVNGVLSSFVPRPGPLKRDFWYKNSANSLLRKSQTSFTSTCSRQTAISSSYSSTGSFPLLQKRNGAGATGFPSPAASGSQVTEESASEEGRQASTVASVAPQRKIKHERVVDAPSGQKQNLRDCSPPFDSSRPQKRKISLLLPCRRNDPLILPSPPQLGYRVTAEDLDLEKRAAIQCINQVLKGKTEAISTCGAVQPFLSSTLPASRAFCTSPPPVSALSYSASASGRSQNSPGPGAFL
ncbi:PREDICTED: nuclear envelope pore membrane protein POM 121-like [Propithecus coquereli]|uniref:nuclear envelope pore membrane protein POM 121-like n=1 Tax=Propithecus coquereli TaxID=379532 RepID=UPI00063EEDA7|nr:PREDICTED: nuclear envelope pore membrane protein POM 121-like [Propithecus coquereli]